MAARWMWRFAPTPTARGSGTPLTAARPSTIHGRAYDGFPITVSSSVTIRAVACRSGCPDSSVSAVTYTLEGTAETPTFSPDAGTRSLR